LPTTDITMAEPTNHMYNLRPQPMERNKKYIMKQARQQSAKEDSKTTCTRRDDSDECEPGIRTRDKKIRRKRNEALLKELNQLHEWEALLPLKKEDMSPNQRTKAL